MRIDFFEKLPDNAREQLVSNRQIRTYARGQNIYQQGEQAKGVYFILSGLVGLVAVSDRGTEHLLRFFKQGEYFGHRSLIAEEAYYASSKCLVETEVEFLPKQMFLKVLNENSSCMMFLTKKLALELGRAERIRMSISEKDVLSRAAEAVIYLKELKPDHLWTRKEIADFCSSTTPTIIRSLGALERKGLICQNGRRLEIRDRQGLLDLF